MAQANVHPITAADRAKIDQFHAQHFRTLESPIEEAKHMASIASELTTDAIHKALAAGSLDKEECERVVFVVGHVFDMINTMSREYRAHY